MPPQQGHVLGGGPAGGKARGGLDVIRPGVADHLAQTALLLLGEQARLDDDFQYPALAGGLHRLDFRQHLVEQAVLYPAQVHHHVDFRRAGQHGVGGLQAGGMHTLAQP